MDLVTLAGDSLESGHRSWGRVVRPFLYPGVRPAILCPVPDLIVVDELKFDEIKTRKFNEVLNNLKVSKAVVIIADNDQNVVLSARNMADVNTEVVGAINVYDILSAGKLVLTKDALNKIEEVYA